MKSKKLVELQMIVDEKINELDFTFEDEVVRISNKLKSMIDSESRLCNIDKEYLSLITLDYLLKTWLR